MYQLSIYLIILHFKINIYNIFKLDKFPSPDGIVLFKRLLLKYLFIIVIFQINI